MKTVGFVGLGHMGLAMAINCVEEGFSVLGYDLMEAATAELEKAGGQKVASLSELASACDVMITVLQTGEQVQSVCQGRDGLFVHAKSGSCFVDCSTIDVITARALHQQANQYGIDCLDAPMSGGAAGAKAGQLTFMVGGLSETLARVSAVLDCMAKKIIHAGAAGNGQAAKLCNNQILAVSMIAVSEAFLLAEKFNLPAQKLHEIVTHASGQCWVMNQYVPVAGVLDNVPANDAYQPGFSAAMMLKDLNLSQSTATDYHQNLPMGRLAQSLYQTMVDEGGESLDFSAIIEQLNARKD